MYKELHPPRIASLAAGFFEHTVSTVGNKTNVSEPITERVGDEDGEAIGCQSVVALRTDSSECFDQLAFLFYFCLQEIAAKRHDLGKESPEVAKCGITT